MSLFIVPILVAFGPALVTYFIPRRFAVPWMVLLWTAWTCLWYSTDFNDDPAMISFAMLFGFFLPVNALATLFRTFELIYLWSEDWS